MRHEGMMNWRCILLWWHRIAFRCQVSPSVEYIQCSCGREYGINHDVRVLRRWREVSHLYENRVIKL